VHTRGRCGIMARVCL